MQLHIANVYLLTANIPVNTETGNAVYLRGLLYIIVMYEIYEV